LQAKPGGVAREPNTSDTKRSVLAAEVLDVLEQLDDARLRAKQVFDGIFLRLLAQRYPIGTLVEIEQVSGYSDIDGATHARVTQHLKPEIFIEQPEMSQLLIDCAPLHRDGRETGRVLRFRESVLGREYWRRDSDLPPRAQLMKLIDELSRHPGVAFLVNKVRGSELKTRLDS